MHLIQINMIINARLSETTMLNVIERAKMWNSIKQSHTPPPFDNVWIKQAEVHVKNAAMCLTRAAFDGARVELRMRGEYQDQFGTLFSKNK